MKKLCFVTTKHGTLNAFVLDNAESLHDNSDCDITFICNEDKDVTAIFPEYIHYLPVSIKRGISISGLKSTWTLIKIFKKNKFDFVQYSTPNASLYASIAAKISRVPVRLYCQWGIRYVGMAGFSRFVFKQLEKLVCTLSSDIRAVSYKNRDFAIEEGLYKSDKVRVLGKGGTIGVVLSIYDIENKAEYNKVIRDSLGIKDEFVFGFVGRFSRDKGSNELLEAFKNISEIKSVKLICIGRNEADGNIDKELFDWAKNSDQVIFTGRIDNKELKKYYAAMDCYVHPSYREGFGMVIQEAAAMGCAIITTDIPGASEVMEDEISCILAKPRDVASLEEKMHRVMNNTDLRKSLGQNARERVKKYFDRKIMLETQRKDYERLLNKEDAL